MSRFDRPSQPPADPPPNLWDSLEPPTVVPVPVEAPVPGSIQEAFEKFHAANPFVYEALRRLALELVERGRKKIGIGMLTEVVRWEYARQTSDASSDFKINNNYRSRYARLLMENVEELEGVFEVRELKAA